MLLELLWKVGIWFDSCKEE